jgi:hypothetical protein
MIFLNTVQGDIGIDAVLRETIDLQSTLTEHPVEFGANVADHIFTNPKTYILEGGVSDVLFKQVNNDIAGGSFGGQLTRSQTAWEVLQAIQLAGQPFSVQTGLELIDNVLIIGLNTSRSKDTANALLFQCTIREVIFTEAVELQLDLALLADDVKTKSSPVNEGQKQPEEVTSESLLLQVAKLFFGGE